MQLRREPRVAARPPTRIAARSVENPADRLTTAEADDEIVNRQSQHSRRTRLDMEVRAVEMNATVRQSSVRFIGVEVESPVGPLFECAPQRIAGGEADRG
jgi:hypothetical protein